MSKQQKALERLFAKPKDFHWQELITLMSSLSFVLERAGGSARKFVHPLTGATLFLHEPHPNKILKAYQVRDAIDLLKSERITP